MIIGYPVIFTVEEEEIEINFIDFNKTLIFEGTLEKVIDFSENILQGWLDNLGRDDEDIPEPSCIEKKELYQNQFISTIKAVVPKEIRKYCNIQSLIS